MSEPGRADRIATRVPAVGVALVIVIGFFLLLPRPLVKPPERIAAPPPSHTPEPLPEFALKPVDPAHVAATLPFLTPHLQVMVRLQQLTGMRPGEVDRGGEAWVYRPAQHKTARHGKARPIHLGPRAQAAITEFLLRDGTPPEGFGHLPPE